jgi:FtsZ-binding cell division protein ZapB
MQEIEEYKIKAVALHNQNMELQSMYSEVAEQYENLKSERTKYFGVDMKKY